MAGFIPTIAREGFFLSPLISTGEAYMELTAGLSKINPSKVKLFTIQPDTLASRLWAKQFTVKLDAMDNDALHADIIVRNDSASQPTTGAAVGPTSNSER